MKKTKNNNKYFKYNKNQTYKFVAILVVFGMFVNILNINEIVAYYSDTESTKENSFSASMLDFILTNNNLEKFIGPEVLGEVSHSSVVIPVDGSLPMQYDINTSIDLDTSDIDFCNGLILEAKLNGISKYLGPLPGFTNEVITEFGSWEFRLDLPPTVSIPNNIKCNAQVLFSAWREDITNKEDSGWYDEEILDISLTSRMVVLNEIYAKPNGITAPKDREYIELYNNSSTDVDVLGWQISEIAGTTEKFYPIVASGALPSQVQPYNGASTLISSGGFLVLEFGGSASYLNDGGDTIKLYDNTTNLLDSHTYSSIPAGKSVVRYPDGIGFWVDPEATPGTENMVSMEDLRLAGFSDEMITIVLELMTIKNTALLNDTEEVILEPVKPDVTQDGPTEEILPVVEESIDTETGSEEVVEPTDTENSGEIIEEPVEEILEVITDISPATEPEEVITEESEVIETPIVDVVEEVIVEPADAEISDVAMEEIIEEVIEEVVVEEEVEAVVEESAPAVEEAPVIETISE